MRMRLCLMGFLAGLLAMSLAACAPRSSASAEKHATGSAESPSAATGKVTYKTGVVLPYVNEEEGSILTAAGRARYTDVPTMLLEQMGATSITVNSVNWATAEGVSCSKEELQQAVLEYCIEQVEASAPYSYSLEEPAELREAKAMHCEVEGDFDALALTFEEVGGKSMAETTYNAINQACYWAQAYRSYAGLDREFDLAIYDAEGSVFYKGNDYGFDMLFFDGEFTTYSDYPAEGFEPPAYEYAPREIWQDGVARYPYHSSSWISEGDCVTKYFIDLGKTVYLDSSYWCSVEATEEEWAEMRLMLCDEITQQALREHFNEDNMSFKLDGFEGGENFDTLLITVDGSSPDKDTAILFPLISVQEYRVFCGLEGTLHLTVVDASTGHALFDRDVDIVNEGPWSVVDEL